MSDTVFSRAKRGLGATSLGIPDIVAKTKGNPQDIMNLVMSGQINLTQGLLAKRLADSVAMEARRAQMQPPTVLQEAFPQLGQQPMGQQPTPQGGLQPPAGPPMGAPTAMPQDPMAQQAPQMQGLPVGMAEGGLMSLDFPMQDYAGGGLVAFADGDEVDESELYGGLPNRFFEEIPLDYAAAQAQRQQLYQPVTNDREALRAKLLEQEDPKKGRRRDTFAGLAEFLSNMRPGMTPLEGLIGGFASSAKALTAGEEKRQERELNRLEKVANLESQGNQMLRDMASLDIQLADAKRAGADAAQIRKLEAAKAELQRKFQSKEAALERAWKSSENAKDRGAQMAAARMRGGGGGGDNSSPEFKAQMRTAYESLAKEARETLPGLLPKNLRGMPLKDPERFERMVQLRIARLAEDKYGKVAPEWASIIKDMAGGKTGREILAERAAGRSTPVVGSTINFGDLK